MISFCEFNLSLNGSVDGKSFINEFIKIMGNAAIVKVIG